jgi:hypothetical protein
MVITYPILRTLEEQNGDNSLIPMAPIHLLQMAGVPPILTPWQRLSKILSFLRANTRTEITEEPHMAPMPAESEKQKI